MAHEVLTATHIPRSCTTEKGSYKAISICTGSPGYNGRHAVRYRWQLSELRKVNAICLIQNILHSASIENNLKTIMYKCRLQSRHFVLARNEWQYVHRLWQFCCQETNGKSSSRFLKQILQRKKQLSYNRFSVIYPAQNQDLSAISDTSRPISAVGSNK